MLIKINTVLTHSVNTRTNYLTIYAYFQHFSCRTCVCRIGIMLFDSREIPSNKSEYEYYYYLKFKLVVWLPHLCKILDEIILIFDGNF